MKRMDIIQLPTPGVVTWVNVLRNSKGGWERTSYPQTLVVEVVILISGNKYTMMNA